MRRDNRLTAAAADGKTSRAAEKEEDTMDVTRMTTYHAGSWREV